MGLDRNRKDLVSFEWDIYISEVIEQLATRTGRATVDTLIANGIYGIFDRFSGSDSSQTNNRLIAGVLGN